MFQIGDYVENNGFIGPKYRGTIVGVQESEYSVRIAELLGGNRCDKYVRFDKFYPEWRKDLLYVIKLDKPSRTMTLQEVLDSGKSEEDYNNLTLYNYVTCARFQINRVY